MRTTFPTLHAFAAGAARLLVAIGSFFVFIAWGCVICAFKRLSELG